MALVDRAVARRYGEAFVNTLEATHCLELGLEELKGVSQTYTLSKDLQRFLGSPEISPEEKGRLLARLFSDRVGPQTKGLMELLLEWDRIDHLPAISEEAMVVSEIRQGLLRGKVVTAHPISLAEAEALAKGVGKRLGKRVILERDLDPKLIGGIRVVAGNILLDGSVQTFLKRIRQQLMEVKVT